MNILIKTIPHSQQRYPTVGDWQTPEEGFAQTAVVVSEIGNPDYEFCVAIHELIEMYLAQKRGISARSVTMFDEQYESNRKDDDDVSEPGDDPKCPVYREHQFATAIERLLANEIGLDWNKYNQAIESLE